MTAANLKTIVKFANSSGIDDPAVLTSLIINLLNLEIFKWRIINEILKYNRTVGY